MKLKNETYDVLKWIAIIFLPALTTLVGGIGGKLEYEHIDLVVYCMAAVDTFLGTILGISTINYNKEK
jgi:hypothetical protein